MSMPEAGAAACMNQRGADAQGTKVSLPSQHREKLLGMRRVELGRLSAQQPSSRRDLLKVPDQNEQLLQGWRSLNVK